MLSKCTLWVNVGLHLTVPRMPISQLCDYLTTASDATEIRIVRVSTPHQLFKITVAYRGQSWRGVGALVPYEQLKTGNGLTVNHL